METHELHRLHLEGVSIRELSRRTGFAIGTIRRRFKKAGLPIRSRHDAIVAANKERDWSQYQSKLDGYALQRLRSRKAEIVREWKAERGCQRCGEMHPATLDMHHRDPTTKHPRLKRKNQGVNRRTGGYFWRDLSFEDLVVELEKCDVLCSNCHRKERYEQADS